jgi:hypothetical protein
MSKPWFKSLTITSAVLFAALQALEQNGVVPTGAGKAFADLLQSVLIVTGVFGLRRAVD